VQEEKEAFSRGRQEEVQEEKEEVSVSNRQTPSVSAVQEGALVAAIINTTVNRLAED